VNKKIIKINFFNSLIPI